MTLQESDLQAIDERLTGVEETIISRLEDTEEFFSTRFDEAEARLFREMEQIKCHIESMEARLDRLSQCSE